VLPHMQEEAAAKMEAALMNGLCCRRHHWNAPQRVHRAQVAGR
jgi:hypothetical protein